MLSLLSVRQHSKVFDGNIYPDSVRRVRPPRITIPKTLAALPNNQYATKGLETRGNELGFAFFARGLASCVREPPLSPNLDKGESCAAVDCDRNALRKGVCPMDLYRVPDEGAATWESIVDFCGHSVHVKK